MMTQIKILSYWENGKIDLTFWLPIIENVFKNNYTKFEIIKVKKVSGGLTLRFLPRVIQQLKLPPRVDMTFHFRRPRVGTKPHFNIPKVNK